MFLSILPVEGRSEYSKSATEVSSRLRRENHSEVCSSHGMAAENVYCGFHAFPMPFSKFEVMDNACALFLQTIRYKIEDCT
jgi:hypothetical protein